MIYPRHITVAVCLTLFSSCDVNQTETAAPSSDSVTFNVEPAPEWTALFDRTSGWFGGDGIFAIPLDGADSSTSDSVMFLFSDTMVGEISNGTLQPGYTMINNSVMMLKGEEPLAQRAEFLVNEESGQPQTLFVPETPNKEKDDYYWLGDGFVNLAKDNTLYIFAYRIRNTHDGSPFPFREVGNSLIAIPKGSKYPFEDHRQMELPFSEKADSLSTSFGVGILANIEGAGVQDADGYVYVYGVRGKAKELVAARVKAEVFEEFSSWEFFDGNGWSGDAASASAIADSVSNELSVTPIGNNRYALVYQYAGLFPAIYMQIGASPVGPFGPRLKVWDTSSDINKKNLFTYNAKAHPAISKPGELLVSYNVNSFDFFNQIKEIPNLYRPRFVRIIFGK